MAWEKNRGIVFLHENFKLGSDIMFAVDAFVVIIASETPTKEDLILKQG